MLTPKINVIEYLVLRWTYLIKNANYEKEFMWQVAQDSDLSI